MIEDRLRRASAGLIEHVAPEGELRLLEVRAERRRRAVRSRFAIVAIAAAALATFTFAPSDDAGVEVATGDDDLLAMPERGEVRPDVLSDGTPVFVVGHDDGTVGVLSAVSTHKPFGLAQLLGWCPRMGAFDDGMYSSAFDTHGRKIHGPAPSGLPSFETRPGHRPGTVLVGAPRAAPSVDVRGTAETPGAQPCSSGPGGQFHADGMVLHDHWQPRTLPETLDTSGELVLIADAAIVVRRGEVYACDSDTASDPDACRTVRIRGIDPGIADGAKWATIRGEFLARPADGALDEITFTRGWKVERDAGRNRLDPLPPYERSQPVDPTGYDLSLARGLWRLNDVEDDDQTLTVTVVTGGCLYFSHMTVDSIDDSSVTLTAWNQAWSPKDGYSCDDALHIGQYRVRLPEPLRGRRLDGQCEPGDDTVEARQCPSNPGR